MWLFSWRYIYYNEFLMRGWVFWQLIKAAKPEIMCFPYTVRLWTAHGQWSKTGWIIFTTEYQWTNVLFSTCYSVLCECLQCFFIFQIVKTWNYVSTDVILGCRDVDLAAFSSLCNDCPAFSVTRRDQEVQPKLGRDRNHVRTLRKSYNSCNM